MVSGLYEFKVEHALFSEMGLSGNTGHTSNLMEPFTTSLDVVDDEWNANENLLLICGNPGFSTRLRWEQRGPYLLPFFPSHLLAPYFSQSSVHLLSPGPSQ